MKLLPSPSKRRRSAAEYRLGSLLLDALNLLRPADPDDEMAQFTAFATSRVKQAHGQLFQDIWALWESRSLATGYFVEVGANDGVSLSNTFLLESLAGRGSSPSRIRRSPTR